MSKEVKLILKHVKGLNERCVCCKQKFNFTEHCPVIPVSEDIQRLIDEDRVDYLNGKWLHKVADGDGFALQFDLNRLNRYLVKTKVEIVTSI